MLKQQRKKSESLALANRKLEDDNFKLVRELKKHSSTKDVNFQDEFIRERDITNALVKLINQSSEKSPTEIKVDSTREEIKALNDNEIADGTGDVNNADEEKWKKTPEA